MERSAINAIMTEADRFFKDRGFLLPPFAYWTEADFRAHGERARGITASRLGWDITDFGLGTYDEMGLFLFTVRNGFVADLAKGKGMLYAEKLMITKKDQHCPMHRHDLKAEDIINRGGGDLCLELFMSDATGGIDRDATVEVPTDGVMRTLPAGGILKLSPGESVTLMPGVWHHFWGEKADVCVGEVSTVNDDVTDNVFEKPVGRFPTITEDTAPLHLLVGDYERLGLLG